MYIFVWQNVQLSKNIGTENYIVFPRNMLTHYFMNTSNVKSQMIYSSK